MAPGTGFVLRCEWSRLAAPLPGCCLWVSYMSSSLGELPSNLTATATRGLWLNVCCIQLCVLIIMGNLLLQNNEGMPAAV